MNKSEVNINKMKMCGTDFPCLRLLCLVSMVFSVTADVDPQQSSNTREIGKSWSSIQNLETQPEENPPCKGHFCLFENQEKARRKFLNRKTLCGENGCLSSPSMSDVSQELDSSQVDSYGIQYNGKRSLCTGQRCLSRGSKKQALSAKEIQDRLQAQLAFLQSLNRRQEGGNQKRNTKGSMRCRGQMCWFRGKKEISDDIEETEKIPCIGKLCPSVENKEARKITEKEEQDKKLNKRCKGQMCWFRGKRDSKLVVRRGAAEEMCKGQMCWFRGKRENQGEKFGCKGQMCWFRGKRNFRQSMEKRSQGNKMCRGQMCWFRGKKEIQGEKTACKGQMCWFRGKRQINNELEANLD